MLTRAGLHSAATFGLIFAALGAYLPFWPLWFADWGLTAAEIGQFTAATLVVRVVAGALIPILADRFAARRLVLAGVGAAGAAVFLLHLVPMGKGALLAATLATGIVYAGMVPLSDALGSAAARSQGFAYAPVRAVGSLAFLLTNLIGGALIGMLGPDVALWWIVIALLLSVPLALTHPGAGKMRAAPIAVRDLAQFGRRPVFVLFALAIGLTQGSHAVLYAYGSLHWDALGLGEAEIGQLWAFSVAVEVLLMLTIGSWMVARLGSVGAIALAGLAGILRWTAMLFDPTGVTLWGLQALHALTFALGHLGAIAFIAEAVPERLSATAQGVFGASIGGIMMALGTALAALVYPDAGGGVYAVALVFSGVGLVAALALRRTWSGGLIFS